jgi:hypothetical protein
MAAKPVLSDISDVSNIINKPPPPTPAPVAAPATTATAAAPVAVASAPATGTDPNAAYYSWTNPREREAAAAAAKQGIDYWGTTSPQSRAAAFASQDAYNAYKFKGQEWNDPIAQRSTNNSTQRPVVVRIWLTLTPTSREWAGLHRLLQSAHLASSQGPDI